jgi:hypothetical protein
MMWGFHRKINLQTIGKTMKIFAFVLGLVLAFGSSHLAVANSDASSSGEHHEDDATHHEDDATHHEDDATHHEDDATHHEDDAHSDAEEVKEHDHSHDDAQLHKSRS